MIVSVPLVDMAFAPNTLHDEHDQWSVEGTDTPIVPRFSVPLPLKVCGAGGGDGAVAVVAGVDSVDVVTSAGELVVLEPPDFLTAAPITPISTSTTTTPPIAARQPFTVPGSYHGAHSTEGALGGPSRQRRPMATLVLRCG